MKVQWQVSDTSELFEFAEETLDQIALSIDPCAEGKLAFGFRFAGMLAQARFSLAKSCKALVS